MNAVVSEKVGSVRVGDVPIPNVEDGKDILIKVTQAAICGSVGCCAFTSARLFGPSLIISADMVPYRLEYAKKFGADITINGSNVDAAEEIKKITKGKGVDVAIEAVGSPKALQDCIEAVRGGGEYFRGRSLFSYGRGSADAADAAERSAAQSMEGQHGQHGSSHVPRSTGKDNVTPILSHRMSLAAASEAYRLYSARSGEVMKISLIP